MTNPTPADGQSANTAETEDPILDNAIVQYLRALDLRAHILEMNAEAYAMACDMAAAAQNHLESLAPGLGVEVYKDWKEDRGDAS